MNIDQSIEDTIAQAGLERSPNTTRTYRNATNKFTAFILTQKIKIDQDVSALEPNHFIRYASWLNQEGYSKKTVGVYASGVKYYLDWLVLQGHMKINYEDSARIVRAFKTAMSKRENKFVRFPGKDDADNVRLAAYRSKYESPIRERDIAIIEFLFVTGCRNNEVRALTCEKINLKDCRAIVIGKGNKERVVFFTQRVADTIRYYWAMRGFYAPQDPAFSRHDVGINKKTAKDTITTATVRNIVSDCVKDAGIEKGKFTPHYFRHAFAIRMLRETGDLAMVQDLLGHADPKSTRVYAKIYPDDLQAAYHRVCGE